MKCVDLEAKIEKLRKENQDAWDQFAAESAKSKRLQRIIDELNDINKHNAIHIKHLQGFFPGPECWWIDDPWDETPKAVRAERDRLRVESAEWKWKRLGEANQDIAILEAKVKQRTKDLEAEVERLKAENAEWVDHAAGLDLQNHEEQAKTQALRDALVQVKDCLERDLRHFKAEVGEHERALINSRKKADRKYQLGQMDAYKHIVKHLTTVSNLPALMEGLAKEHDKEEKAK